MSTHSRRTGSEELRRAALASNATGLRAQIIKRRLMRRLRKVAAAGLSLTAYERDRKDRLIRLLGVLLRGRLGGQRPLAAIVAFSEWPAAVAASYVDSCRVVPPSGVGVQVIVRRPGDREGRTTSVRNRPAGRGRGRGRGRARGAARAGRAIPDIRWDVHVQFDGVWESFPEESIRHLDGRPFRAADYASWTAHVAAISSYSTPSPRPDHD
jgi:hypothetical protein